MGAVVDFINCDSGSLNYRNERYHFATARDDRDDDRADRRRARMARRPVSWKVVTSADTEKDAPFEVMPITIWNTTRPGRARRSPFRAFGERLGAE